MAWGSCGLLFDVLLMGVILPMRTDRWLMSCASGSGFWVGCSWFGALLARLFRGPVPGLGLESSFAAQDFYR